MASEDPGYAAWLRAGPCALAGLDRCHGLLQIHHHTRPLTGDGLRPCRGSRRAHDHDGMPLCLQHHHDFTVGSGYFKGWWKQQRLEWQDGLVRRYRLAYSRETF